MPLLVFRTGAARHDIPLPQGPGRRRARAGDGSERLRPVSRLRRVHLHARCDCGGGPRPALRGGGLRRLERLPPHRRGGCAGAVGKRCVLLWGSPGVGRRGRGDGGLRPLVRVLRLDPHGGGHAGRLDPLGRRPQGPPPRLGERRGSADTGRLRFRRRVLPAHDRAEPRRVRQRRPDRHARRRGRRDPRGHRLHRSRVGRGAGRRRRQPRRERRTGGRGRVERRGRGAVAPRRSDPGPLLGGEHLGGGPALREPDLLRGRLADRRRHPVELRTARRRIRRQPGDGHHRGRAHLRIPLQQRPAGPVQGRAARHRRRLPAGPRPGRADREPSALHLGVAGGGARAHPDAGDGPGRDRGPRPHPVARRRLVPGRLEHRDRDPGGRPRRPPPGH